MAADGVVPKHVYLYEDPSSATLSVRDVADHVGSVLGLRASVRGEFFAHHRPDLDGIATAMAAARVTDPARPMEASEPPQPLVHVERRMLDRPDRRVPGVLYDGFLVQRVYRSALPPKERNLRVAHVTFTSRLLGTFGEADRRYHARAVVLGYPAVVSTSGLVEGPAKPRGFYAAKRGMRIESADARYEALKEAYAGRFLDHDDPRLTDVAKGYAMQALFYPVTGEPFCENPDCVLFNAHWQEEMLHAQIESGLLCARHRKVAESLRGGRRTRRR